MCKVKACFANTDVSVPEAQGAPYVLPASCSNNVLMHEAGLSVATW